MKVLPFEIQATNTLVYKAGTSHKTITRAGLCATSLLELDQDWGPAGPVSSPREPRKVRLARALLSIPHLLPQASFRCHFLDLCTNIYPSPYSSFPHQSSPWAKWHSKRDISGKPNFSFSCFTSVFLQYLSCLIKVDIFSQSWSDIIYSLLTLELAS